MQMTGVVCCDGRARGREAKEKGSERFKQKALGWTDVVSAVYRSPSPIEGVVHVKLQRVVQPIDEELMGKRSRASMSRRSYL